MAAVFDSYDAVGQAEDVANVIANIAPYNTPVSTLCAAGVASATMVEYQEQGLDTPAANALPDGADAPTATANNTVMLSNYVQNLSKTVSVSGDLNEVDKYGRDSETTHQLILKGRSLANDREYAVVGLTQAGGAGTKGTVGRTMKSLNQQVNADTTISSTTGATLAEVDILTVHQAVYMNGGDPTTLVVNPGHAITIAGFTTATGRLRDFRNEKTLVNAIDLLVTPFGELSVVLDRQQRTQEVYLIDPAFMENKQLSPLRTIPLGKKGDYDEIQLIEKCSICLLNTRSAGMIDTIA